MRGWYVYIVRCADGTLYSGVTTDVERRVNEHNNTKKGAKYTRSRRPVILEWSTEADFTRSEAQAIEHKVKQVPRRVKEKFLQLDKKAKKGRRELAEERKVYDKNQKLRREAAWQETLAKLKAAGMVDETGDYA